MRTNSKKYITILLACLLFILVIVDIFLFVSNNTFALLQPKGVIALRERNLIFLAVSLMLIVVIPVFIFAFFVSLKYREGNKKITYSPEWTGNNTIKIIMWAFPTGIILILAMIVWKETHALDPYKPIESKAKPITIQVVALSWKWLFIYPEENIATVNFIQFPVHTPVNFELTADAPMNSFWIPRLGGQMYAMSGMQTQLHLQADEIGDYDGTEVEINGPGYAGMRFTARASSQSDFNAWIQSVKQSHNVLNSDIYTSLAKPSEDYPITFYATVQKDLYNTIIMKDMVPPNVKHAVNMGNMDE